jgi:hypothetical protein
MLGPTMNDRDQDLRHALSLMETALSLLDRAEASAEVGALLQTALERLQALLAVGEDGHSLRV